MNAHQSTGTWRTDDQPVSPDPTASVSPSAIACLALPSTDDEFADSLAGRAAKAPREVLCQPLDAAGAFLDVRGVQVR
jgi:hypothetical protein